jgi:hypothetical protein
MPAEGILDNGGGEEGGEDMNDLKLYVTRLMEKEKAVDSVQLLKFLKKSTKVSFGFAQRFMPLN